jgi:hypothetical protein
MSARKKPEPGGENVKPEIIDLGPDAVIENDPPEAAAGHGAQTFPPQPESMRRKASRGILLPLVALIVGALGGGWFYRDWLASYLPPDSVSALSAKVANIEARNASGQGQYDALAKLAEQLKTDIDQIEVGLNQSSTAVGGISSTLRSATSRMDKLEASYAETSRRIDTLKAALAAVGTSSASGATTDPVALQAIYLRLDALEQDIATLKSSQTAAAPELSQALAGLKAKVSSGAPYTDELSRIARLVPAAEGLAFLAVHAQKGLPDAASLARELVAIVPLLTGAPPTTNEPGYLDWFLSLFGNLIRVKTIGETDWQSVATQSAALAGADDLRQAIALIDKAGGNRPEALAAWRDRAENRLKLEDALTQTGEAVIRQIAAKG